MTLSWALTFALSACVGSAAPPLGQSSRPIIGGTNDTGDPAVMLLLAQFPGGSAALCTTEVVSPHVLLTAAHCVDPDVTGPGATYSVFTGYDINSQGGDSSLWLPVRETHYNTAFVASDPTQGNDTGVVILDSPVAVTPMPMNHVQPTASWDGQNVRVVGFGVDSGTDTSGSSAGTKRQVTTTLTDYAAPAPAPSSSSATFVEFGDPTHGTCEGDSGGPALMTYGTGREEIVGITSFGPMGCDGGSYDTPIHQYAASWVDPYIQEFDPGWGTLADGKACTEDAQCVSSLCAMMPNGAQECADSCTNAPNSCSGGTSCQSVGTSSMACVPAADQGGGGGCAVAPPGPAGTGAAVALLTLLGLAAAGIARRRARA